MKLSLALTLAFAASFSSAEVPSLTSDNFAELTTGKTVFLKFFAPWCGHCKKMAPDWEKLAEEFKDSKDGLVAEVDCTADGKPLCEANGVRGYPTLKWGDPANLEDYQGGRDFNSLKTFADENLKPVCSPTNIDLCEEDKKAEILKFQAMSDDELDKLIAEKEAEAAKAEADFSTLVENLQTQYKEATEAKDAAVEAVKASGLGLMKAVKASKVTVGSDEL